MTIGTSIVPADFGRSYSERIAAARYARSASLSRPMRPLEQVIDVLPVEVVRWGRGRLAEAGFAAQSLAQGGDQNPAAPLRRGPAGLDPYRDAMARLAVSPAAEAHISIRA
jgi:hypothetical protein